jgi:hypothetical protein
VERVRAAGCDADLNKLADDIVFGVKIHDLIGFIPA